jgi:hypothetical protein
MSKTNGWDTSNLYFRITIRMVSGKEYKLDRDFGYEESRFVTNQLSSDDVKTFSYNVDGCEVIFKRDNIESVEIALIGSKRRKVITNIIE